MAPYTHNRTKITDFGDDRKRIDFVLAKEFLVLWSRKFFSTQPKTKLHFFLLIYILKVLICAC